MSYTVESIKQMFEETHEKTKNDPHYKSEVTPLFDENGKFSRDNWNSGQDVIRRKLLENDIIDAGNTFKTIGTYDSEGHEVIISATIFNEGEEWSVVINVIGVDLFLFDSYLLQWYKNRGTTDTLARGDHGITIEEYVYLLNLLEKFNFYDVNNWEQNDFMYYLKDPDEEV